MATTQELLDLVDAAIEAKLKGNAVESFSIGGKSISTASLQDLLQIRRDLKSEAAVDGQKSDFLLANLQERR